jgi:hypothetical protein
MKKLIFVLSLTAFLFKSGMAQNDASQAVATAVPSVVVHKDPRIDLLVKKKVDVNKTSKMSKARTARGYRLLIINTNSRDEAVAAKTKVYTFFPELKAYLSYQSPYFKLKAGNFQTRDEAERYRKNMASFFPKGVFIVNDIVEIKPEKETTEE